MSGRNWRDRFKKGNREPPIEDRIIFATLFPTCENVTLIKDVGMIPYTLHRDFGYGSYLFCYKNGEYSYAETEVLGLKLQFMVRTVMSRFITKMGKSIRGRNSSVADTLDLFSTVLDAFFLLIKCGRQINVLNLISLKWESIILGHIYKMVNRRGILYLKLDMNPDIIKFYEEHPWKLKASRRSIFFPEFDIISVETRNLYRFLKAQHPVLRRFKRSIHYVPNGVDSERLSPFLRSYESKQDIILYVGRITHHPKRSGILLEAFAGISAEFPNWRLLLIGPMESGFRRYFEDFLAKNRGIQDRISYVGVIEKERSRLYEYYSKAKIFAFPSESEGFSIAMLEAGAFGDVTVGSDIPSIRELTNNGSLGYLCPINDIDCFIDTLRYALTHEEDLKKKSEDIARFVRDNFNWGKICATLDRAIVERIEERVSQLAS